MRCVVGLMIGILLVAGCDGGTKETASRGPFALAGKYILKTVNGDTLPVRIQGDTVLFSDSLILSAAYTYMQWQRITTGGVSKELQAYGDFVSTLSGTDSVTHVSVLRQSPSYKTYSFPISIAGVATIAAFPFTYVYKKQ